MSGKKGNAEFQTVGEAIRSLLNSYRLESKFDEAALVSSWERLVGAPIAKRTKKVFIKDHTLFVEFKSALHEKRLPVAQIESAGGISEGVWPAGSKRYRDFVI